MRHRQRQPLVRVARLARPGYDNSEGMGAEMRRKCAREIESGQIVACQGDYTVFLNDLQNLPRGHVICANFAVLNMISDLRPLFAAFWRMALARRSSRGVAAQPVLLARASAIPPDARSRGGASLIVEPSGAENWRAIFTACNGAMRQRGPEFNAGTARGSRSLIAIERGRYDWDAPLGLAQRIERRLWQTSLFARSGKFWFLVFRKCA